MAGLFDDLIPGAKPGAAAGGLFADLIPAKPKPAGLLRSVADLGIEAASGVARGVKATADAFGADNAVSRGADAVDKFAREYLSAAAKADDQRVSEIMAAAQDAGVWEQVKAAAEAFTVKPGGFIMNSFGTAVPTIAATMIPGVGQAGAVARLGALGAMGAAQGAGAVKGSIYEAVKAEQIKAGASEAEAEAAAVRAQEYGGENTANIAGGAALGGAASATGVQPVIAKMLQRGAEPVAQAQRGMLYRALNPEGLVARTGMGALKEAPLEAAQGGQEQYASNIALQNEGFDTPAFRGVAGSAALEGLASAGPGAAFAALDKPGANKKPGVADILGAPSVDDAIDFSLEAVTAPAKDEDKPLGLATGADGLPFEADPRFAGAPVLKGGERPAAPVFGSKQQADIYIGEQALFQSHESVEVAPGRWQVQPTAATRALLAPNTTIPVGEATEVPQIPIGEATFLDPVAEAERIGRPSFTQRRMMERGIPAGEAAELIPAGEATEYDQVPAGEASELDAETIQADDLLARDGEPFTSKTGAQAKAYASGGGQVVAIPDHFGSGIPGYVVRPLMPGRPSNTRGTDARDLPRSSNDDQRDLAGSAEQVPGASDGRGADAARSGGVVGLVPDAPGRVDQPAEAPSASNRPADVVAGAGDADTALTPGSRVTLNGTPYTVTAANSTAVKLQGADGGVKMVARNSRTFQAIQQEPNEAARPQPEAQRAEAAAPAAAPAPAAPAVVPGTGSAAVEADGVKPTVRTFGSSGYQLTMAQALAKVKELEADARQRKAAATKAPTAFMRDMDEKAASSSATLARKLREDIKQAVNSYPDARAEYAEARGAAQPASGEAAPASAPDAAPAPATTPERTPKAQAVKEALAAKKGVQPAPVATHKDPGEPAEPAAVTAPRTAAEWAEEMARLRKTKPRPLDKLYGAKGPTPEQVTAHAEQERAWNAAYRKAGAEQKKALERDNAEFRAKAAAPAPEAASQPEAEALAPAAEPAPAAASADQAAAILNAAAEPPKGKERLDVLKDVKAGAITPEEVAAAYPAAPETAAQADKPKVANETPPVATGFDAYKAVFRALVDGTATVDDYRAGYARVKDAEATKAELGKMTKDALIRTFGIMRDGKKDELVSMAYEDMLRSFGLGKSYGPSGYMMVAGGYADYKTKTAKALDELVAGQTAEDLAAYAAERKRASEESAGKRAALAEAIQNPKTLADFQNFIRYHQQDGKTFTQARMMLTPEQRAAYDELSAESTRSSRKVRADEQRTTVRAAGQTTAGEVIATKHTRDGHDLWVVKLADRVSKDDYITLLAGAKRLGGNYSSFRGNGAVPGFQFRSPEAAQAFLKLAGGDTAQATEVAQERRNAFEDDRSQSAAERLTEMADRLEERADESLGRDRKANTDRRARFAAAAEAAASADKAMAKTMRNIASAITGGGAKFLDRVRQKVQVELLQTYVANAKSDELRAKYPSYTEQDRHKGERPTFETADYAEFPTFTAYRSDLASLGRKLLEVDGTKKMGERIMKVADDVSDAFTAFVKEPGNLFRLSTFSVRAGDEVRTAIFPTREGAERAISRSGLSGKAIVFPEKRGVNRIILSPSEAMARGIWKGDGDKRITLDPDFAGELVEKIGRVARRGAKVSVPWQFERAYDRRKQLSRMGIETPAEFRAALREFIAMREQPAEADKIKAMERAMVGRRNDGLDFFPTPEGVADEMVAAADIQPGMRVLEPSAGMGHIAERIRATEVDPDVVEFSNDRRELLEAKGFNVVARDFMDLTEGGYDRILMNPPFSDGRDIQHVRHAYDLLKPGGRLVAIMGESAFFNQNKRATEFREWLESVGGTDEKLPEGTFNDPSLPVTTGANARMVVIEKPAGETGPRSIIDGPGADAQFSRATPGRTGVPMADAKAVVATIREALPTAPDIVLHDSVRRAPENLRRLIRQAGADNDVEAVYHDGEIHVFPGNIASIERMQFVVAHHEVRHHGLRSMLGPQMGPAMLRMYASNANLKAAADAKMAAGLADTRILAVEEALADMPVEELQALTGWARIVAAARQWLRQAAAKLRRAGLNTLADAMEPEGWTDNDIAALVQRAEDVSRGGAAPFNSGGTVFQRAYHGTPYRGIERFDTEAIGTGEGAQAYGWGLYFASKREVADFYRRKLSGESDRVFTKDGRTIQGPADLAEAYYQPGRIVRGYSGADKVLEFKRTDNGGWVVKVVGVKANGDPMEFERPRWHATQPDGNTLRDALEEDGWQFSPAGQLYEVEVPEDSELLLWDKPLSEQPAMVREAIREAIGSMDPENAEVAMRKGDDLLGSNAYTLLQTSDRISGAEGASELLASLGVKGIKYLDGTSRGGRGNGHNYVIFSGDDVAIQQALFSRADQTQTPDTRPQAVRAVQTMPRSPLTGRPVFDLLDAAGNRIETQHHAKTADEALENYRERPARQAAARAAAPAPTYAMPEKAAKAEGSNWRRVQGQEFTALDEDDAYLYHVTSAPAAAGVREQGLVPNAGGMFGGFYANYSAGKVFLTERSGVSYWQEKVGQQLEAAMENPPAVTVLRIPKDKIKAKLLPDTVGSGDARAPAFYSNEAVFSRAGTAKTTAQRQVTQAVRNTVADMLGNAGAKVSWWDKTLGTQYAKAQKFPAYRRVFDAVQQYLEDTSAMANEAADQAKGILPKLETWKDLRNFGLKPADAKAIAAPIFTGTLTDQKVYSDGELRARFSLTPEQIGQYRQFRATVDTSLDQAMAAEALRMLGDKNAGLRELALTDRAALREGIEQFLTQQAIDAGEDMDAQGVDRGEFTLLRDDIAEKYKRIDDLKAQGYAPLMRFGKYKVNVTDRETGETLFFGLYESKAAANSALRDMQGDPEFQGADFEQGVLSQEQYKLFSAMPLDSLEMFAEAIGADQSDVYQDFIRLAKSNRSAMKRLLKRKGTAGFSEDVPRVLAAFVTSNARMAAGALNMPTAKEAAQNIRDGDVQDEAIKLLDVVQNPTDTAGAVRGLMFVNFIGGSIASAVVNLTQPLTMTLPYLSQFGGGVKAAKRLMSAGKMVASGKVDDLALRVALKRAETDGIVSPQEIHHLQAQAMGTFGTHPLLQRAAFVWGAPFSLAEQFNRRVSFIAAFQTAREQGIEDAFGFAEKAVIETQGLYSKANAPNLARGTIGAAALTFKQFSIHYLEWMGRMWKSGPQGKKAVGLALALLILAAGTDGLPFADDLDDLVDTLGQALGYDMNVKRARREFVAEQLGMGDAAADVMARGFSAVPGVPLDVSLRMSMGNLLPGTGMFLRSNTDKSRDLLEIAGPAGGLAKQYIEAGTKALRGDIGGAVQSALPVAFQNAFKAADMWATGEARDTLGRKVMDADAVDGLMKFIGFQPQVIARESEKIQMIRDSEQLAKNVEGEIASAWARAIVDKDADGVAEARAKLAQWNEDNPESPIRIKMQQIISRARKLREDRASRFITSVAPERRRAVAEALE